MRLGNRRPNTAISFIDQWSEETLLRVAADNECAPLIGYHLYDEFGQFVAESNGMESFPGGISVKSVAGETLLDSPVNPSGLIKYRLYNREGNLLTCSDGLRTQVFRFLRMESEVPRHQNLAKARAN